MLRSDLIAFDQLHTSMLFEEESLGVCVFAGSLYFRQIIVWTFFL